jgi:D-alanyl-lipoteichoic acid acyltransferase DltB (MBOAT superfamily)
MLFNSFQFAGFFTAVYGLYLYFGHKNQNRLLLLSSYLFYGAWDYRFLSLIMLSTCIDYYSGLKIEAAKTQREKKTFLLLSVVSNLSILGYFKYFDFFVQELASLCSLLGIPFGYESLSIVLPIGISFYTFQTMSYSIDIYRGDMKATRKFLDFALFVAFFPQLIAGPIERARNLLPQIINKRTLSLEQFYQGSYLIFWGLFQKVFIADNLAAVVDPVFESGADPDGVLVLVALYAFALQIYCDFAGYSNMARGLAKVMGIELSVNFNLPYMATNPEDFWRRWHITLSDWIRDYVFLPLFIGLRNYGKQGMVITIFITYTLIGLWHGAAMTFVLWGVFHAFIFAAYQLLKPAIHRLYTSRGSTFARFMFPVNLFFFFHVTVFGLLLFRSSSIAQTIELSQLLLFGFDITGVDVDAVKRLLFFGWFILLVQFFQYRKADLMFILKQSVLVRAVFYLVCFYSLIIYGESDGKAFIYFQF